MAWFRRSPAPVSDLPAAATSLDYAMGGIEIGSAWARASLKEARTGGGYFTLANKGAAPDRLVAASSPAAGRIEIHAIKVVGSELRMRELADGLALAPGTTLTLKPRGYHLMLLDLKAPLEPGARTPVVLTFEKAGNIDIELIVAPAGPVGREAM